MSAEIKRLEDSLNNPKTSDGIKAKIRLKIAELKANALPEKKEEVKVQKAETQAQKDLKEKIALYEKALNNKSTPVTAQVKIKAKLTDAKKELEDSQKELAEDKKEAKKEEDAPAKAKAVAKPKTKKAVKKRIAKSKTRTSKLKDMISELQTLINKNKALKKRYAKKGVDLERDASRKAKPFGYRFKGKGDYRTPTAAQIRSGVNIDYEGRPNRADVRKRGKHLL